MQALIEVLRCHYRDPNASVIPLPEMRLINALQAIPQPLGKIIARPTGYRRAHRSILADEDRILEDEGLPAVLDLVDHLAAKQKEWQRRAKDKAEMMDTTNGG